MVVGTVTVYPKLFVPPEIKFYDNLDEEVDSCWLGTKFDIHHVQLLSAVFFIIQHFEILGMCIHNKYHQIISLKIMFNTMMIIKICILYQTLSTLNLHIDVNNVVKVPLISGAHHH